MAIRKQLNATTGQGLNKKGFTLIELSIVLSIIGLLTGGILVAQNLINTVKGQAFIRQIQQFDIAVGNFQARYGKLPGDSELFDGDGNGYIEDGTGLDDGNGQSIAVMTYDGEMANFWRHLQLTGFSGEGGTFTPTVGSGGFSIGGASINSPKSKQGKDAGVIASNCSSEGVEGNCYTFANWTGLAAGFAVHNNAKPAFTPADALAIDTKIDDGNPQMGAVQNRVTIYANGNFPISLDCDNQDSGPSFGTEAYSLENSSTSCFLAVGIGGQQMGQPYNP